MPLPSSAALSSGARSGGTGTVREGRLPSKLSATRRPLERPGSIARAQPAAAVALASTGTAHRRIGRSRRPLVHQWRIGDRRGDSQRVGGRAIVETKHLGAGGRGQRRGRGRRPFPFRGRSPVLPGSREKSTQEVLPREGDEEGATKPSELSDAARICTSSSTVRSK